MFLYLIICNLGIISIFKQSCVWILACIQGVNPNVYKNCSWIFISCVCLFVIAYHYCCTWEFAIIMLSIASDIICPINPMQITHHIDYKNGFDVFCANLRWIAWEIKVLFLPARQIMLIYEHAVLLGYCIILFTLWYFYIKEARKYSILCTRLKCL